MDNISYDLHNYLDLVMIDQLEQSEMDHQMKLQKTESQI